MKVFYVSDANGEFFSEDKKVRYKELSGKELHNFLELNGSNNFFSTDTDDEGNVVGVELPQKYKAEWEKERLHSRYLREVSESYITISLEMNVGEELDDVLESFISDEETEDIFVTISKRELIRSLQKILPSLDKEEYEMINSLILSDDRMTLREYEHSIWSE